MSIPSDVHNLVIEVRYSDANTGKGDECLGSSSLSLKEILGPKLVKKNIE